MIYDAAMLIDVAYTIAGFVVLTWGADRFVSGAGSVAKILGVPPLLIGLTIVGFATSAPEILVSISAASEGLTGMAVGNALGSNIANIGLILGITAIVYPLRVESETLKREYPLLMLIMIASFIMAGPIIVPPGRRLESLVSMRTRICPGRNVSTWSSAPRVNA